MWRGARVRREWRAGGVGVVKPVWSVRTLRARGLRWRLFIKARVDEIVGEGMCMVREAMCTVTPAAAVAAAVAAVAATDVAAAAVEAVVLVALVAVTAAVIMATAAATGAVRCIAAAPMTSFELMLRTLLPRCRDMTGCASALRVCAALSEQTDKGCCATRLGRRRKGAGTFK
eukprot:6200049-Pleurochrysis_carterae.AAC.1